MDFYSYDSAAREFAHLLPPKSNPHKKASWIMVALGVFLLSGLIQITQWNQYALEIIPLKTFALMGTATENDFGRLAEICLERHKYSCALDAYTNQVKINPQNLEARLSLGLLQVKLGDLDAATATLSAYLKNGGDEPRARFELGKAYSKIGQPKKALSQFEGLLRERASVFQVSVTREYVNTLMQTKKWSQAKHTIEHARHKSVSYNAFMTAEYKVILKHLGSQRRLASE
jgi:tetratricopeptide (TPR) repeat protein